MYPGPRARPVSPAERDTFMNNTPSKAALCRELFTAFARVGAFTFGGGYAMLPLLKRECVENHHWTTEEEMIDLFAISQCTPGVIAVNTATYLGFRTAGLAGAAAATAGLLLPSLVIILALAAALSFVVDLSLVQHALGGVRVCVCVLIANAVLTLGKKALVDKFAVALYLGVLALGLFTDLSTVWLILGAGLVGFLTLLFKKEGL